MPKRTDIVKGWIGITSNAVIPTGADDFAKRINLQSGGTCCSEYLRSPKMIVTAVIILFSTAVCPQTVVQPWELPCREERVEPNLDLKLKEHLLGQLKDQTGAPFAESKIVLKKLRNQDKFATFKEIITDKQGHFDLGALGPGKYRFLPSPNRGFKQPKQVHCSGGETCELNLVLELNPTDQAFAGCPIQ